MRRFNGHLRRGTAALGAALLPAIAETQPGVGGTVTTARANVCAPGGMMLRQPLRPSAAGGSAGGGHARDSVIDRRALELERMAMTRLRSGAVGGRMRIDRVRGWIGVSISELAELRIAGDSRYVRYCDYPVVVSVEAGSPAQRAGIQAGDTIVAYNGVDLRSGAEIPLDRLLVPDDTLRVGIRRDGQPRTVPVIVGRREEAVATQVWTHTTPGQSYGYVLVSPSPDRPRPATPLTLLPPDAPAPPAAASEVARVRAASRRPPRDAALAPTVPSAPMPPLSHVSPMVLAFGLGGPSAVAGAQVIALDEDLGAAVGAKSGLLVLRVGERTPADEAGLRPGDVIVLAGGRQITSTTALQQALLHRFDERAVPLRVVRKGKTREIVLRW